jgi:hypothetical protein
MHVIALHIGRTKVLPAVLANLLHVAQDHGALLWSKIYGRMGKPLSAARVALFHHPTFI